MQVLTAFSDEGIMTIEILCKDKNECSVLHGKLCQALSDLNLKADVVYLCHAKMTGKAFEKVTGLVFDGLCIPSKPHVSVDEIKEMIQERTKL